MRHGVRTMCEIDFFLRVSAKTFAIAVKNQLQSRVLRGAAIAAGAGASGAINQWYDRDIDALMTRTKMRPIPAGVMAPAEALTMGLVISAMAVLLYPEHFGSHYEAYTSLGAKQRSFESRRSRSSPQLLPPVHRPCLWRPLRSCWCACSSRCT